MPLGQEEAKVGAGEAEAGVVGGKGGIMRMKREMVGDKGEDSRHIFGEVQRRERRVCGCRMLVVDILLL